MATRDSPYSPWPPIAHTARVRPSHGDRMRLKRKKKLLSFERISRPSEPSAAVGNALEAQEDFPSFQRI